MDKKPSLRKLITQAKNGDAEATAQLVSRLIPLSDMDSWGGSSLPAKYHVGEGRAKPVLLP